MICNHCSHENIDQATFCTKCSRKLVATSTSGSVNDYEKHLLRIAVVFFSLLTLVLIYSFTVEYESYTDVLWMDSIFAFLVLIFCVVYPKKWKRLFSVSRVNGFLLGKVAILVFFSAVAVSFLVDFINGIGLEDVSYSAPFLFSPAPLLLSIVSTALFPAIFEELAFRGIILRELAHITSLRNAILLSAILFTIIHFSAISALWIFPLGLFFGYLRAKHRTLWYGVIGHFVYNSVIVFLEFQ